MLSRLLRVQKQEERIVLLLGSFSFLVLAATTIQGAASEALFINIEGAERLPYGIMLAQIAVIPGFYVYRLLRRSVRAVFLNPAVVVLLALGLGLVYYFLTQQSTYAAYVLMTLVPLYASILAAENARLGNALIDARSARRLFPVLGAIGGAGASFGAWLVTVLTERFGQAALLLVAALVVLLVTAPATFIKESMRPRVSTPTATLRQLVKKRYILALLASAALVIAVSTVVRYQFGAAAQANFSGDQIGVFYGQFALALNLASIAFTMFISRAVVDRLGAARSLLVYPGGLGLVAAAGAFVPGLVATTAGQFVERLLRQNIHNSVSAIVGMPMDVGLRVRMANLATGYVQPLAVLLTSLGILLTAGELAPAAFRLDWTSLYWPIAGLCALLVLLQWYVRVRYPEEIKASLHARRLQLDETSDVPVPMDAHLRLALHGYLASDLPERTALALELLRGHETDETVRIVRRQWPLWEPWLRTQAISLLDGRSPEVRAFLRGLGHDEPDEVRAALVRILVEDTDNDALWALATARTGPQERAEALACLAKRGDPRAAELMRSWISTASAASSADATAAAKALAIWPSAEFDDAFSTLLPHAPIEVLRAMALRPRADAATLCLTWLAHDRTHPFARDALQAIGEAAVPVLERAALDPRGASATLQVLARIKGQGAHVASLRLMAHHDQAIRRNAVKARLQSDFELSAAERKLADENIEEALQRCERFQFYVQQTDGVERSVAASELGAALEDVFLSLKLIEPQAPYRQALLAYQSPDTRQRSFAVELLDELLPGKIKHRLLPIMEGQRGRARFDMQADRHWLELQQKLEQRTVTGAGLRALKSSSLFGDWRVNELELLTEEGADADAQVVLRNGQPRGLETTLLTGRSAEFEDGDIRLPLAMVYRAMLQAPRCGHLWLKCLAERVPETSLGEGEVTRSGMVSLASRTAAEDHGAAGAFDLWQRMFFLRSNPLTQDLPAPRLRLIAEISRSLTADPGEIVVHEGRLGNHFYLLCTGRMEIMSGGAVVGDLGPSDGFGALELMRGRRRPLTVRASESSELIAISRVDFLDLLEVHPSLVRSFARILAAQILAASERQHAGAA
jgi:hypothetical protein